MIHFFAAEIHCSATLTLVPTSSQRVVIIASLLHRSHHLHAYRRGQLFFYLFYNQLVICGFLVQGTGCCSLAPALFQFSGCLCTSFEYFLQKGHLYVSAFGRSILLCFPWAPAAAEGLGEHWPVWWNITKIHIPAVWELCKQEFSQKIWAAARIVEFFCNKLNRSNTLTAFYFRKVMQPSSVKTY